MVKKTTIAFVEVRKPITELVTKFGGQPVWVDRPQWPLSRSTGKPMQFIGQVRLEPELFGEVEAQMAYLFMTYVPDEAIDDGYSDETWDPDGGENAVILQPGNVTVPVEALFEGPALFRLTGDVFTKKRERIPCEYAVDFRYEEDPEFVDTDTRFSWSEDDSDAYYDTLKGNKLGGTPLFDQLPEYPDECNWKLVLQLDQEVVPFEINFGDVGTGYLFMRPAGSEAKFLWQCG
jgi:uncharacterized protein YwqG